MSVRELIEQQEAKEAAENELAALNVKQDESLKCKDDDSFLNIKKPKFTLFSMGKDIRRVLEILESVRNNTLATESLKPMNPALEKAYQNRQLCNRWAIKKISENSPCADCIHCTCYISYRRNQDCAYCGLYDECPSYSSDAPQPMTAEIEMYCTHLNKYVLNTKKPLVSICSAYETEKGDVYVQ